MSVRLETRGPFEIYRFERGSTHRITLELPAIVLPVPPPPVSHVKADANASAPALVPAPL